MNEEQYKVKCYFQSLLCPLRATQNFVDIKRYMGTWFVVAMKPAYYEKHASNAVHTYSWKDKRGGRITDEYTYTSKGVEKKIVQKAYIHNKVISFRHLLISFREINLTRQETNAEWRMSPLWPLKLTYLIIEIDSTSGEAPYSYAVVGFPSRDHLYILSRSPSLEAGLLGDITARLAKVHGYDLSNMFTVEHCMK